MKGTSVRQTLSQDGNVSISTLTFVASVEDNGKDVACRASNVGLTKVASLEERTVLTVHCKLVDG